MKTFACDILGQTANHKRDDEVVKSELLKYLKVIEGLRWKNSRTCSSRE
jgi:hypothetical protein